MASLKRSSPSDAYTSAMSSKVFVRSTKSGKVQKVVRELYLRQDIPCSSKICTKCLKTAPRYASGVLVPFVLSEKPAGTTLYPSGHYLIPDTNALLNALDLFEHKSAFYDVIILQTALEELRNRSLPLYNRLIGLTKSEEKRFYVFFNDFRLETYIERADGESINDRNDRAVRRAVKWYGEHLRESTKLLRGKSAKPPSVVMLSDDKENLRISKKDGIEACNLKTYVNGLENANQLLDMMSAANEDRISKDAKATENLYQDYYSMSKITTGLKSGTLHQGIFNVSQYNYLEGSVHVPTFDKSLIVLGRENMNRSVHGDVVVVELLPKVQWKEPSTKIIDDETMNNNDNPDAEDGEAVVSEREKRALLDEVKQRHVNGAEGKSQPTARVIGVVKRNWRQYVGHVDEKSLGQSISQGRKQQTVFLIAMDKRIPKIRIRTRQASEIVGKRVLVTIDSWDRDSRYPSGHFVRALGELETKGAETEALLLEYDVQYRPFPKSVLDCLPTEGHDWKVPPNSNHPGWRDRRDLRDLVICSIDPIGCQDIDDALHARLLPNGNIEVGVHIADVSHFVRPNNAMDAEASVRGTTVYLVDKRIDMLPPMLGTDLCSLKPYVERFAFSVIWELTPDARVLSADFTKSVIKSREAFSYEAAQLRVDDASQTDELTVAMRLLLALSQKLKQQRLEAGALSLSSPEVRVEMESETSDPIDVKTKKHLATMSLVEEFMLLANATVARKIHTSFPQTAMLRRHGTPPKSNFETLAQQLKAKKKLEFSVSSSRDLADSLDRCTDPTDPFFNTLIRIMATRCMLSAEYFCSGSFAETEFRHYGLASEIYTHFTSPIRRYADLIVHRQLAAAIEYEPLDLSVRSKRKLELVAKNINVRHRNAQMAGRSSIEYYVGQALKGRVVEEPGYVMRVFQNGVVIFVPRFGIECLVRLRDLVKDGIKEPEGQFDGESWILQTSGSRNVFLELFGKCIVRIRDEKEEGTGKRKVRAGLVKDCRGGGEV